MIELQAQLNETKKEEREQQTNRTMCIVSFRVRRGTPMRWGEQTWEAVVTILEMRWCAVVLVMVDRIGLNESFYGTSSFLSSSCNSCSPRLLRAGLPCPRGVCVCSQAIIYWSWQINKQTKKTTTTFNTVTLYNYIKLLTYIFSYFLILTQRCNVCNRISELLNWAYAPLLTFWA